MSEIHEHWRLEGNLRHEHAAGMQPHQHDAGKSALLLSLGELIAGLHVPRSLGSVMVPTAYDDVRLLIGDFGWSSREEIAAKLAEALGC